MLIFHMRLTFAHSWTVTMRKSEFSTTVLYQPMKQLELCKHFFIQHITKFPLALENHARRLNWLNIVKSILKRWSFFTNNTAANFPTVTLWMALPPPRLEALYFRRFWPWLRHFGFGFSCSMEMIIMMCSRITLSALLAIPTL